MDVEMLNADLAFTFGDIPSTTTLGDMPSTTGPWATGTGFGGSDTEQFAVQYIRKAKLAQAARDTATALRLREVSALFPRNDFDTPSRLLSALDVRHTDLHGPCTRSRFVAEVLGLLHGCLAEGAEGLADLMELGPSGGADENGAGRCHMLTDLMTLLTLLAQHESLCLLLVQAFNPTGPSPSSSDSPPTAASPSSYESLLPPPDASSTSAIPAVTYGNVEGCSILSLLGKLHERTNGLLRLSTCLSGACAEPSDEAWRLLNKVHETYTEVLASVDPDTEAGQAQASKPAAVPEHTISLRGRTIFGGDSRASKAFAAGSSEVLPRGREEEKDTGVVKAEPTYEEVVGPLAFGFVDLLGSDSKDKGSAPPRYHYRQQADYALTQPPQIGRQRALACQVLALQDALPVHAGASIFVRVDHTRCDVVKALITGPEGTPYAHGAFEFDIFMPLNFPKMPPKVQLCTTSGGNVRFNPNLYQQGTVCLSLLGTWGGPSWCEGVSTLLQVLVSIQALIFTDEPHYNEPGTENFMHTPGGQLASQGYNMALREATLRYAIMDQMSAPPAAFADVLKEHWRLKKDALLATWKEWGEQAPLRDSAHARVPIQTVTPGMRGSKDIMGPLIEQATALLMAKIDPVGPGRQRT